MSATPIRKYNPGFLSDNELVASFCVRTHEFESIVEMLRECTGRSNKHQIVIGPRGSGKTSLLLRVAAEVRRDADLAAGFFPIVFAEESYEVGTAGEFWLECLARLADQAPKREDAPNLHRTLDDMRAIRDDQQLGERCLATVLDFADREDKRLVLMVENLNMMFQDIGDRNAGWRLRKVLQTEPRIVLLASATSRFDEIDQPDHALYQQFREVTLHRLTTEECAVLWKMVSGQKRPPGTIRSLEILTGGSPRLLAIVARFGAGLSFRELMDNLLDLVDDHTEYFKSHLDSLPPQERCVYLALAKLWKPALTKEVAERARLGASKCSAQLKRLVERGAVLEAGGSARRKQYYLSERMYNIYYLMRRSRGLDQVVEVLIRFMASYYSPDELKKISTRIALEAEDAAREMRSLYQSASVKLMAMSKPARQPEEVQVMAARTLFKSAFVLAEQNRNEEALAAFDELLRRFGGTQAPVLLGGVAAALVNKGVMLGRLNRPKEELAAYDEVLRQFGGSETPELLGGVAMALVNKGIALGRLDRPEESMAAYDEVLCRFGGSRMPELLHWVARAIFNKGIALGRLGRPKEALVAYEEVVHRFGERDEPTLLGWVASAYVNKLIVIAALKRPVQPRDIEALLKMLPKLNTLSSKAIEALMKSCIELGPDRMLKLIQDSPAADLLLPLATALEREMGLNPRVPEEVAEVAEDIRRDLAKMREDRSRSA